MSLETLLEAAQFIEVETDEDGRTRVKAATPLQSYAKQVTVSEEAAPKVIAQPLPIPTNNIPVQDGRMLRAIGSGTRDLHNRLEKNRRAHLKDCFDNLRKQIPNFDDIKASNLSILRNAVRTIQQLQRKEKELEMEMQRLAREKIMSQERLSNLRMELAAMNIEYDIAHFMEANNPENHSSSTATADEEVPAVSDDDDKNSSSTLSTTSPSNSSANYKSPAFPTSPIRSPRSLLYGNVMSPPALPPSITTLQSILNKPLADNMSAGQGRVSVSPIKITTAAEAVSGDAKYSTGVNNPGSKSVNQRLQATIYQRQEQQLAQQRTLTKTHDSDVTHNIHKVIALADPSPSHNANHSKQAVKRKHGASTSKVSSSQPISIQPSQPISIQPSQPISLQPPKPISIQPLIKSDGTTTTANKPTVINLNPATVGVNPGAVTLNQLLPSRYPAMVNTVDLGTLLKLSGAQVVTEAKQASAQGQDLLTAVAGTTSALEKTAASSSCNHGSDAATIVSVASTSGPSAGPQTSALGVGTQVGTASLPQPAAPLAAAPAAMPVQLITPQQLQQLITPQQLQQLLLQATLQQQLQQQLAQQLQQVAVAGSQPKTATLTAAAASAAPVTSPVVSHVATPGQSETSTATVTPITMPTIPFIQPLQDLSATVAPAVQLAPTNLQQTIASAQLNQVVVPQMLKTLGQFPLLQQPALVPIVVTMPSVVSTATPNVTVTATNALANSITVKKET